MHIIKRIVPFEVKELLEDDDHFIFRGYASTFGNVDRGDDVIEKGAFLDSIAEMETAGDKLPVIWQHNTDEPIGIFPTIREDNIGLFVEGRLPKSDTFVSGRVIPQMKVGSITKMSIGFSIWMDGGAFEVDEQGIRHLKKLKLWEVSLVTIPMNNEARITEMKSAIEKASCPDELKAVLVKCENLSPELIESIMNYIDLSNKSHVEAAKKDMVSLIENLKDFSDREFEEKLKIGVNFSGKNAKTIISALKAAGLRDGDEGSHRDGEKYAEMVKDLKEINQLAQGVK